MIDVGAIFDGINRSMLTKRLSLLKRSIDRPFDDVLNNFGDLNGVFHEGSDSHD